MLTGNSGPRPGELDRDHIAAVHAHQRPRLSLMINAIIVAVHVGIDSKVAACSNDARTRGIGNAYGESHDPTAQRDSRDDHDNCKRLALQHSLSQIISEG